MSGLLADATTPRRRFSGAAISGDKLSIATIEMLADGSLSRVDAACAFFKTTDRHQVSTIELRTMVRAFCRRQQLEILYQRRSSQGSIGRIPPVAFKIEAVLDLIPRLSVERIAPQTVTAWQSRCQPVIPAAAPMRYVVDSGLQQKAIDVAAYFALNPQAAASRPHLTKEQRRELFGS